MRRLSWSIGIVGLSMLALTHTAAAWTDDPLPAGTPIRAVHLQELREALKNKRNGCGLSAPSFSDDPVSAGRLIRATHIEEIRAALSGLQVPTPPTFPTVSAGSVIQVTHIEQLRRAIEGASCVPPACACSAWVDGSCNAGGCTDQRQQTRTCAPAGCQAQSQCRPDASCVPSGPTCGDGACDGGEDCNGCSQDCGSCGPSCGNGMCENGESSEGCCQDCGGCVSNQCEPWSDSGCGVSCADPDQMYQTRECPGGAEWRCVPDPVACGNHCENGYTWEPGGCGSYGCPPDKMGSRGTSYMGCREQHRCDDDPGCL